MADNKNQHFVPKVHLVPFSTNGDGNSISLFNIKSSRAIHGAGIKHQCSGSYFYGEDGFVEKLLGRLEGQYARVVREFAKGISTSGDQEWMRMFMLMQISRTEAAIEINRTFLERMSNVKFGGKSMSEVEAPNVSKGALVAMAVKQFRSMVAWTKDLEFCVLRNRTKLSFLTSDNPLVFTNRFYLQYVHEDTFGASSAGALMILPIGLRLAVAMYDPGIYLVDRVGGFVHLKKPGDILAFRPWRARTALRGGFLER